VTHRTRNRRSGGMSTPVLLAIFNAKFVVCTVGVAILEFDSWTFKFYHTSMWFVCLLSECFESRKLPNHQVPDHDGRVPHAGGRAVVDQLGALHRVASRVADARRQARC